MSNALKDLGYYTAMAEDAKSARLIAQGVRQTLENGMKDGSDQTLLPELAAILAARGDAP